MKNQCDNTDREEERVGFRTCFRLLFFSGLASALLENGKLVRPVSVYSIIYPSES